MSDRLRTALGFLILLVAATAPLQIVYGQQSTAEPPKVLAWFVAASPVAATIAALSAAYWTAQQARETARQATEMIQARRAEHLLPKLATLLEALDNARHYNEFALLAERFGGRLPDGVSPWDLTPEWVRSVDAAHMFRTLAGLTDVLKLYAEDELIAVLQDLQWRLPPAPRYEEVGRDDLEALEQERSATADSIEAARSLAVKRGEELSRAT